MRYAILGAALGSLFLTAQAQGQTAQSAEYEWTRRLTINGFAGAASAPPDAVFTGGAAVGWGIARRWLIEGSASWFDLPPGASSFAANLTALVTLSTERPALPFVRFGAGLYAASYGPPHGKPPDFYDRRISDGVPRDFRRTYRDPSIVAGGGVHLLIARNWALRPEAEVTVVLDGGHAYTVVSGVIRLAYAFERRPITPARARR